METPPDAVGEPIEAETSDPIVSEGEELVLDLEPVVEEPTNDDPVADGTEEPTGDDVVPDEGASEGNPDAVNPLAADDDDPEPVVKEDPKPAEPEPKTPEVPEAKADPDDKPAVKDEPVADTGPDYKALYEEVMRPFKANGKEITLKDPSEVKSLLQKGADYTKKLQSLQPHLKVAKMLENHGLDSPDKISYLIDLHNKDPEAIKKLIVDANIDPMDIDTSVESTYKQGDHSVSDKEMVWDQVLADVNSSPEGQNLIVMINNEWDKESKETIYADPQVLTLLTKHKQDGLFDKIANEVSKRQMLGQLAGTSFIDAYHSVGTQMHQNGELVPATPAPVTQPQPAPVPAQTSQVVATQAAPRKTDTNADKVKAAAGVRTTPKPVKADFNPLNMSDEEFEKNASLATRL
ncbi:MAG: hypothetical protein JKY54_01900 [Flavobacteriales bacterium]|nr:hypothetical protein [Flavobacteriales bacterium]